MKVFVMKAEYWEDGVFIVAAIDEDHASRVIVAAGHGEEYEPFEIEGATAEGPARVLWE